MASGRAFDFLAKRFADVNRIHGLHMIYEENRVRRGKTLWSNVLGGTTGLLTAVALTCIPSFALYPLIVHGKPFTWATLPAFFPIFFELTVLFSAFTAVFALMIFNQLPRWYHPIFNWERFKRVTNDGFFLVIEAVDPRFSETRTRELLESIGGQHVTLIHD